MRYLIILLCLLLPACATKQSHERPVDYVTVIANLPDCKRPEKIKLEHIDNSLHIGSVKNTNSIDEVILTLYLYNKQLEETLKCYEKRRYLLESPSINDTIENAKTSKTSDKE